MLFCYTDVWFLIEWDGEGGDCTPVPQKRIVGPSVPSEGDHVEVKEGSTRKVYGGVVIKKGGVCKCLCVYLL